MKNRAAKQLTDEYEKFKSVGLTPISWCEHPLQYLVMRLHYPPIDLEDVEHAIAYYRAWCADEYGRLKFVFITHTVTHLSYPGLGSSLVSNITWHYSHTSHPIDANHRWIDCGMMQKEKTLSAIRRAVNIRSEYIDQMDKDEPKPKAWGTFRTLVWLYQQFKKH